MTVSKNKTKFVYLFVLFVVGFLYFYVFSFVCFFFFVVVILCVCGGGEVWGDVSTTASTTISKHKKIKLKEVRIYKPANPQCTIDCSIPGKSEPSVL